MNKNKNVNDLTPEERAAINDKITRFGAILVAVGVVMYCFSITKIDQGFLRLLVSILACLIGALGIFIIIVVVAGSKAEKQKRNFFLYDRKKKQNIDVSELNISSVREKIADFMAAFKIRGKLYVGDLFDEKNRIPDHFKTLFCYELLCQISEQRANAEIFLSFGKECADIFSEYLTKNGDGELAMKIRAYILDFSDGDKKTEEFRELIVSQKESLEEKMLSYTVKNIEKFV